MAKKGGPTSLQSEVNSDEEWRQVLQKVGLVVVDVYSDWCGPCIGMMSNLKKVKLEFGNEYLHLVIANADKVKALERFRGTSEPTWVFLVTGQLLRVIYGANAPLLMKTIEQELTNEMECIEGKRTRIMRPFTEMTPEELQKQEEVNTKKRAEEEEERKEREEQLDKLRRRYYERVARKTSKQSVVLYFPHTIAIPDPKTKKKVCQAAYKMMAMYDQIEMNIKDQLEIQLAKDTIPRVFYDSDIELPEVLLQEVMEEPCMASLIHEFDIPKEEEDQVEKKPPPKVKEVLPLGYVEKKLASLAFGQNMDMFNPNVGTVCHEFMVITPEGVKIPPLWSPRSHLSKAAALEVLFPYVVEALGIEMEPLPPPSLILIFEANRAREILDAAEPYSEDVLHVGFFDAVDPLVAKKVCTTIWELIKFPPGRIAELKMVLALRKVNPEPMLVLVQLNPLYMSADTKQGRKETELFFPPSIDEAKEPNPFGAQPVIVDEDGDFMVDEDGHRYRDEYIEEDGEKVLRKRVIRLQDGKKVNILLPAGEKLEFPESEGGLNPEMNGNSEDEEAVSEEHSEEGEGQEGPSIEEK